MQFMNITVRIAGVVMFAIPASLFAYEITWGFLSPPGNLFSPASLPSFLVMLLFGIPGLVIAAKGPLYGDVARENRRTVIETVFVCGLVTLVFTLFSLIIWATPDVLFPELHQSRWDAFFSWLYVHVFACGALWTVGIAVGLASLLSGRNLFGMSSDQRGDETKDGTEKLNPEDSIDSTEN